MKTIWRQDELATIECSLGHQFNVDATTEENLGVDYRIGLYAICPDCNESELYVRVSEEARKIHVSLSSFNEACEFARTFNLNREVRTALAQLLEATWHDGVKSEQVTSMLERIKL